jgi:hypothetical protein
MVVPSPVKGFAKFPAQYSKWPKLLGNGKSASTPDYSYDAPPRQEVGWPKLLFLPLEGNNIFVPPQFTRL